MKTQLFIKPALALIFLILTLFAFNTKTYASLITPVFINEIHYDNSGSDTNEFVELAGVAGTNLFNWSVYFYNGSNNQVYKSVDISSAFIFSDMSNGFGFYAIPLAGIQNGPSDAIALINDAGVVMQFLSYEGSLTAQNGPAIGETSIDIGIYQPSNTPEGYSLQLTGSGNRYQDFDWQLQHSASIGQVNYQQSFIAPTIFPTTAQATTVSEPTSFELLILTLILISSWQMTKRNQHE